MKIPLPNLPTREEMARQQIRADVNDLKLWLIEARMPSELRQQINALLTRIDLNAREDA